jgi:TonB family protein
MWKIIVLLIIFIIQGNILAQEFISGEITQNTRWSGAVYINGDVIVPRGILLSIEKGTRILFKPKTDIGKSGKDKERAELIVHGVLIAESNNPQEPIIFSVQSKKPQMNDWYGIIIKNFYDKSSLKNCIVEFGYKGLTCYGSSPSITDSEIRFNHNTGISCEVKSNPVILRTLIYGNGFAGINCELASFPKVSECTITQNNFGVIIFSRSAPDLGRQPESLENSKGQNRIHNNFDFEVYNHSANEIYAQNNFWNTSNSQEIRLALYDKEDNPSYGEVKFLPIFFQGRPYAQYSASIALSNPSQNEQDLTDSLIAQEVPQAVDTLSRDTALLLPRFSLKERRSARDVQEDKSSGEKIDENLLAFTEKRTVEPQVLEPKVQEPVLEVFLDSGGRKYIRRARPVYPAIYLKTETEGDVLIEVIVDRQGKVDEFRVLKSDGDLFTEASIVALRNFQYRPGKLNGKPVMFKLVERFRFKISGS